MSGGDLDGDVYMAIWDETIMDNLRESRIVDPACYQKNEGQNDIKSDHIADHIQKYFKEDNLGILANLHLSLCTQKVEGDQGPFNEDAVELSRLQGIAVDFAKHGIAVKDSDFSQIKEKVKEFPDFLEKDPETYKVFESPHVLGELYRMVKPVEY
jgi:RNA-dependent RNA polymerase